MMKFLLLFAISMLGVSCAQESICDVNQNTIYTSYGIKYDKDDAKLRVSAQLKFGSGLGATTLTLACGASLTVNDAAMDESTLISASYDYTINSPTAEQLAATYTLVFTDTAGTIYTNALTNIEEISIGDITPSTAAITDTVTAPWVLESGTLGTYNDLTFYTKLSAAASSTAEHITPSTETSSASSGNHSIAAATLAELRTTYDAGGVTSVKVCRTGSSSDGISAPAEGGTIAKTYCSDRSKTFTLQ